MDNRRTLSIIAQGAGGRRPSRMVTISDELDLDTDIPNEINISHLQRRRSSRVN